MTFLTESNSAGFFLSGWYVFDNFAAFQIDWCGKLYPTSEHAYQAAHFLNSSPELAEQIRLAKSPLDASLLSNEHSDKEDPEWKSKRLSVMRDIIHCKLEQHPYVRQILLASGDKYIVEMNDNDEFWGWGRDHNGENHLGKIWMQLREETSSS